MTQDSALHCPSCGIEFVKSEEYPITPSPCPSGGPAAYFVEDPLCYLLHPPSTTFQVAWKILVERVGADNSAEAEHDFVQTFLNTPCREYRFIGTLGFGGKFWRMQRRYYVSCYPEDIDATGERRIAIAKVNQLLEVLPYFEPPTEIL